MLHHCSLPGITAVSATARITGAITLAIALCCLTLLMNPHPALADTGPWSTPVKVSGDTVGGWWPDVAADESGRVHVVWSGTYPDGPKLLGSSSATGMPGTSDEGPSGRSSRDLGPLYYTRLDSGRWTTPNDIRAIWYGHVLRSSIAIDAQGQIHLIYKGIGNLAGTWIYQEDIWHTASSGDTADAAWSWVSPKRMTRSRTGYFTDIAIDKQGVIHVIWTEDDGRQWGLYYSNSADAGNTWSQRVALDPGNPVWWWRAQIVADSRNRLHAVWEVSNPDKWGETREVVYARSEDGGKSWTRTCFPECSTSGPPERQASPIMQQPSLGVDGEGRVLLVFRDPRNDVLLYQESTDGTNWSQPQVLPGVSRGVGRPYDVFAMATDSAGNVHLAGVGYPLNSEVMSLFHWEWNGRNWTTPGAIASGAPFPEFPRLAVGEGNNLHLIWFGGDRPGVDRNPVGIWYSTAQTSAPRTRLTAASILPSPEESKGPAAKPSPGPGPVAAAPSPRSSLASGTGSETRTEFPRNPGMHEANAVLVGVVSSLLLVGGLLVVRLGAPHLRMATRRRSRTGELRMGGLRPRPGAQAVSGSSVPVDEWR